MIYTIYHFFPLICTIDTKQPIVKKDRGLRLYKFVNYSIGVWSGHDGRVANRWQSSIWFNYVGTGANLRAIFVGPRGPPIWNTDGVFVMKQLI
jgi:hypothetical protein